MKYTILPCNPIGKMWEDEDRYIIVDLDNMDVDGEHYSLDTAQKIVDEYNDDVDPFIEWIESDNVICVAINKYQTQCTQWRGEFTKKELFHYFIKEYYGN